MERDITGSRGEVPVVVTGAIAFSVTRAFVTFSVDKFIGFMFQESIQGLFNAVFYETL